MAAADEKSGMIIILLLLSVFISLAGMICTVILGVADGLLVGPWLDVGSVEIVGDTVIVGFDVVGLFDMVGFGCEI